jgi:TRAP-type uncharacterized transport system substrate-binding protein
MRARASDSPGAHPRRGLLAGAALIVGVSGLVLALLWGLAYLHPLPPRTVVMTTGAKGGAYHEFGMRYREILARSGVELELLESAGGIENLRRLSDPGERVDAGFMQGGATGGTDTKELVSLATVAYEPLWFFSRIGNPGRKLERLHGRRISIGPEGSATRELVLVLLAINGIDRQRADFLPLATPAAAEELSNGRIDAVLMVSAWESPVLQRLLASGTASLQSFPRADAYVTLYPYLNRLVLPAGVADMARNIPPEDVTLLAPKTSLVVRKELHPAIQNLLLDAATEVHSRAGTFQKAGQFPAAESIDLPLSDTAKHFHRSGRPFLQRYLPFWIASIAGQILLLLIPLAGALYPLARFLPALYGWSMRRRIFRLYGEMKFLESDLERRGPGGDADDLAGALDRLEERANHLKVPESFAYMLYALRRDIQLVRERIAGRRTGVKRV